MRRFLWWVALLPAIAPATVRYTLAPDVDSKSLLVSVTIDHPKPQETFQIPGWSPGFYVMSSYETKILNLAATGGTVAHPDPKTWVVSGDGKAPITLKYKVLGDDPGLGFFGASVKSDSAYTNGPASFMYVLGRRSEDTDLRVSMPNGWQIATAMDKGPNGSFTAHDYDEMADDPIQMGHFVDKTFTVGGIPFDAVFVVPPGEKIQANPEREAEVLRRISKPAIDLFKGAPFRRYIYFFHLAPGGFQGGLEHRSGTVLALPNDIEDIADLAAHELFHAWNVKQIRPIVLGPFDYTKPQRTGNLWFAEGVTDYYSKILTYRSGLHDASWLMDELSDQVNSYQTGKTRLTKTVEDASRAVWENGGFDLGDLDYYNKGLVSGLIFDATIRNATDGKRSLDDVMRLLYSRYRFPNPGYDEDGILKAINEVAGQDLTNLYTSLIRSTNELPYEALASIGLKVVKPNESMEIAQGWPLPLNNVPSDDLKRAGLRSDDVFQGFDPGPIPGKASVRVLRNGQEQTVSVPLKSQKLPHYEVIVDPQPSVSAAARYSEWARLPTPAK